MLVCGKCDGTGRLRAFSHIEQGACFQCKGTGKVDAKSRPTESARTESPAEKHRRIEQSLWRWYGAAESERGHNRVAWASVVGDYPDTAQHVGWLLAEASADVRRDYSAKFKRLGLPPDWYDRANAAFSQARSRR